MRDIKIPDAKSTRADPACLALMAPAELELLAIEAIKEHRRLFESDQLVYDEWERAKSDPSVPLEQVEMLEADCLCRQERTAAQQDGLSYILDLLGYVPKVPDEDAEGVSPARGDRGPLPQRPRE